MAALGTAFIAIPSLTPREVWAQKAVSSVSSVPAAPLVRELARLGLEGPAAALAINGDESILAVAVTAGEVADGSGELRHVVLIDRPSMERLGRIQASVGKAPRLAFAPTSEFLAVSGSKALQLWEIPISPLKPGKPLPGKYLRWEIPLAGKEAVTGIAFASAPNAVIWSQGGKLYRKGTLAANEDSGGDSRETVWGHEGKTSAASPADSGRMLGAFALPPGMERAAVITPGNKEIELVDTSRGRTVRRLSGHRFPLIALGYGLDGRLNSLDSGGHLKRWQDAGTALASPVSAPVSAPASVAASIPSSFSPASLVALGTGHLALIGKGKDGGQLVLLDASSGKTAGELSLGNALLAGVSPTGRYILTASGNTVRLHEFSRPLPPLDYVRHLRSLKAFQTAQSYVRLMDGSSLSKRLKADLLEEAGREPPGEGLQLALQRLRDAVAEKNPDRIRHWANRVAETHSDHPEALAALRLVEELRQREVLAQAREAYELGEHRVAISLLSSKIPEDSRLYPDALALIRKAESKRSVQTILIQARERLGMGDTGAASALVEEALRSEAGHPRALALREEIASRESSAWKSTLAVVLSVFAALLAAGFIGLRFRHRFGRVMENLKLDPESPIRRRAPGAPKGYSAGSAPKGHSAPGAPKGYSAGSAPKGYSAPYGARENTAGARENTAGARENTARARGTSAGGGAGKSRQETSGVHSTAAQAATRGAARERMGRPSRGGAARKLVVQSLMGELSKTISQVRKNDGRGEHTGVLMELEAELHSIHLRMSGPMVDLGVIHNRLKSMQSQLKGLEVESPRAKKPVAGQATYYDLLNLKPSATLDEIKTAYHKLLKQYHPDLHNASQFSWIKDESERMSRRISKAYEVLSDETARAQYDRTLENGVTSGRQGR